jgi:hypothetical protein
MDMKSVHSRLDEFLQHNVWREISSCVSFEVHGQLIECILNEVNFTIPNLNDSTIPNLNDRIMFL